MTMKFSYLTILTFKLLENGRLSGGHCVPLTFCSLKNAVNLKFKNVCFAIETSPDDIVMRC